LEEKRYWNKKIETMNPEELKKLQEKKLRNQIRYVYDNSIYYHRKFREWGIRPDDIKTLDDLKKIPFTTKEEERATQDNTGKGMELGENQCVRTQDIIRIHSSSGTTGRPVYFGLTRHDIEVWTEGIARSFYSAGIRPEDVVMYGWGLEMFVGGIPVIDALEAIGCSIVPAGARTPSERFLRMAMDLKANVFGLTPSYALYLTEVAREKLGVEPEEIGFKKYFAGAEPGLGEPEIRKRIKEEWGLESARETLGIGEMMTVIAAECFAENGMHFMVPDFIIPELIEPETGEVIEWEEGVKGELVYTAIDREATPLIRFRSKDHAIVWTEPCECGRTSFRLRVFGRTDDMLIYKGVNVFPSAIRDVVSSFSPKVTGQILVVLDKPGPKVEGPIKIKVEYGKDVRKNELESLKTAIEERLANQLLFKPNVILVPPKSIERAKYKAKLVAVEGN